MCRVSICALGRPYVRMGAFMFSGEEPRRQVTKQDLTASSRLRPHGEKGRPAVQSAPTAPWPSPMWHRRVGRGTILPRPQISFISDHPTPTEISVRVRFAPASSPLLAWATPARPSGCTPLASRPRLPWLPQS